MEHEQPSRQRSFWRSRSAFAICALLGIAGIYLNFEHRAHAVQWLPYLLLLACPLMHVFMHRGHGEHAAHTAVREPRGAEHDASDSRPDGGTRR